MRGKPHERSRIVGEASHAAKTAARDIAGQFELTSLEMIGVLLDTARDFYHYALRTERHGDNPCGLGADDPPEDDDDRH